MEILAKILIIATLISGCSSDQVKQLDPIDTEILYKKDMSIIFNGVTYQGFAVLPEQKSYELHIVAQGDLDVFTFTNCHREEVSEEAWNVTEKRGSFIFKKTTDKKKEIKLIYAPGSVELDGPCGVYLAGFEKGQGRHSWGFIEFESSQDKMTAEVSCNGQVKSFNGVSVCQSKNGLIQKIKFDRPVMLSPDENCSIGSTSGQEFTFNIHKGQCIYVFMDAENNSHRLTTFGYEQVLIRK